ncbi:MAG: glycerol-3-phosphate dehydrogenase/oxidase [Thermodesulfobacteriota bacterium]
MEAAINHLDWRKNAIQQLDAAPLDVLVIGGGIVGAGIARDSAMRGLRTGLIEQYDFAFGTSSRSARMLHGGLRYLAQGNFGLVRQASLEKLVIRRIAPHLAAPLPFIFPTYRGTPWPNWKLRIGVKLYDLLCNRHNFHRSEPLSSGRVQSLLPGINPVGLDGGVRYFDGATNDARLVIDTLRSAFRNGAVLLNYARLEEAHRDDSRWRCQLCDTHRNARFSIRSRSVVNAAGPWADKLARSRIRIRGTKGVHVVVKRSRFSIPEAVMMTEDKRVVWAIPWGEMVYIGTTDTDFSGSLENVPTDPEDIDYILSVVHSYFPGLQLTDADLVGTWAGVRPLIAAADGHPSEVSRSHKIFISPDGWLDAAGGKLTTYRLMAEESVNKLVRFLNRTATPCRTHQETLLKVGEADGVSGVIPPPVSVEAVRHYCRHEWALHLDDVMIRRTRWHHYLADAKSVARQVNAWMAAYYGWDILRQQAEWQRYVDFPN